MANKQTICLLNDSFPPVIDGVANTVVNYAKHIQNDAFDSVVITPSHPDADDSVFPYRVLRYPSILAEKFADYPAGVPFSPDVVRNIKEVDDVKILHSHCPIISTFMARELRLIVNAPIVMTYHTKFDIDISKFVKGQALQTAAKKLLAENISACDEVWTVSHGAGENLQALGYEGDYIVMPNGVDIKSGRVEDEKILDLKKQYNIPENATTYLFVGRLMWYKGIKLILDALAKLKNQTSDFRMVFVGEGTDGEEIAEYAKTANIDENCIFVGALHDRGKLSVWYCASDLFLFPSSYDTNGLVVREAAACSTPSVLLRGSCAAEGVKDFENSFLIDDDADSLYMLLSSLTKEKMRAVGKTANEDLYLSWETAVKMAMDRYNIISERYKRGEFPKRKKPMDGFMKMAGDLMTAFAKLPKKDG